MHNQKKQHRRLYSVNRHNGCKNVTVVTPCCIIALWRGQEKLNHLYCE